MGAAETIAAPVPRPGFELRSRLEDSLEPLHGFLGVLEHLVEAIQGDLRRGRGGQQRQAVVSMCTGQRVLIRTAHLYSAIALYRTLVPHLCRVARHAVHELAVLKPALPQPVANLQHSGAVGRRVARHLARQGTAEPA